MTKENNEKNGESENYVLVREQDLELYKESISLAQEIIQSQDRTLRLKNYMIIFLNCIIILETIFRFIKK